MQLKQVTATLAPNVFAHVVGFYFEDENTLPYGFAFSLPLGADACVIAQELRRAADKIQEMSSHTKGD